MLTKEELNNKIKLISQTAWSVGSNTSVNNMIEYIVAGSMAILLEELEEMKNYMDLLLIDGEHNASKNGRLQKSQRNAKAPIKGKSSTETRQSAS